MLPVSQPTASGKGAGERGRPVPFCLTYLCFVWIYFATSNDFYNIKEREKMPHFHFLLSSAPSDQISEGTPAVLPGLRASTMDPGSPPLSVLFCPCGTSAGTCPCTLTLPGLTLASYLPPGSLGVKIKLSPCSEVFRASPLRNRTEQQPLLLSVASKCSVRPFENMHKALRRKGHCHMSCHYLHCWYLNFSVPTSFLTLPSLSTLSHCLPFLFLEMDPRLQRHKGKLPKGKLP